MLDDTLPAFAFTALDTVAYIYLDTLPENTVVVEASLWALPAYMQEVPKVTLPQLLHSRQSVVK